MPHPAFVPFVISFNTQGLAYYVGLMNPTDPLLIAKRSSLIFRPVSKSFRCSRRMKGPIKTLGWDSGERPNKLTRLMMDAKMGAPCSTVSPCQGFKSCFHDQELILALVPPLSSG